MGFSLVFENCASGPRLRHELAGLPIRVVSPTRLCVAVTEGKTSALSVTVQSKKETTLYYIGIDIAKKAHTAAIQLDDGTPKGDVFSFTNDDKGFSAFLGRLKEFKITKDNCIIAMESTGHYHIVLYSFLIEKGFYVSVLNPVQTNAFRKAETLRKTKTDLIDAVLIANFTRFKQPEPTSLPLEKTEALKQLSRHRMYLIQQRTSLKNSATSTCDRIFPELAGLIGGINSAAARAVMKEYGTPANVAKTDIRTLTKTLSEASQGRLKRKDAEELKKVAKNSVGDKLCSDILDLELKDHIFLIESYDLKIGKVEERIAEAMEGTSAEHLLSIPGVGYVCASAIAAEIGSPDNFENAKKLIAFAGIDPSKSQSGESEGGGGHMSKRGSGYLRYALMTAADSARRYDSYFGDYYKALRARGKHHYVAVSAVARKLAGVILVVLKEQRDYEPRPSIQSQELNKLAVS